MRGASVVSVVADVAVGNAGDVVPPGFTPILHTEDTREKALRKKQLSVRIVPRVSAVDAVSDLVLLARLKKPPQGYTLAGFPPPPSPTSPPHPAPCCSEIDGLMLCFKYGTIPEDFPSGPQRYPFSRG